MGYLRSDSIFTIYILPSHNILVNSEYDFSFALRDILYLLSE